MKHDCNKATNIRVENGRDLVIISGPSGCGKDSVILEFLEKQPNAALTISYTTRLPRQKKEGEMEQHGKDYFFVDRAEFERKAANGDFLEYAAVHNGDLYGTPCEYIQMLRLNGKDPIILNIDPAGAMHVKEQYKDAVTLFVLPPSAAELRRRLEQRKSETPEEIRQRMEDAEEQISHAHEYDYVVLNDTVAQAAQAVWHIVEGRNYNQCWQERLITSVANSFVKTSAK